MDVSIMKILCFIIVVHVLRRKEKEDNFYNESTDSAERRRF